MSHYVGIDVSLEASSVCVVDANGKFAREPDALVALARMRSLGAL